jgi:hypothetical protein
MSVRAKGTDFILYPTQTIAQSYQNLALVKDPIVLLRKLNSKNKYRYDLSLPAKKFRGISHSI